MGEKFAGFDKRWIKGEEERGGEGCWRLGERGRDEKYLAYCWTLMACIPISVAFLRQSTSLLRRTTEGPPLGK